MRKENLSWFDCNDESLRAFMADVRAQLSKHFPGKKFSRDKNEMLLTDEEVDCLVKEGKFDKVVECNIRLVISIAHIFEKFGPSLLDVVEEGCKGLVEAAHTYRIEQGRFANVAGRLIKEAIWSAYDEYRELPSDFAKLVKLVNEAKSVLLSQYYCDIEDSELILEYLESKYDGKPSVMRMLSLENVELALCQKPKASIDVPLDDEGDSVCLEATIRCRDLNGNECNDNADIRTADADTRKIAELYLGMLNDRDREIAKLHFGMIDGFEWGAELIADKMGISSTRVNQVLADLGSLKDKSPFNLRMAC